MPLCGLVINAAVHLVIMVRNLVAVSALVLGLAGCSLGISVGQRVAAQSEFKAPVAFKDVYAAVIRAVERACSTDNAYRVVP